MFGLQTEQVRTFLAELEQIPWFSRVGQSSSRDERLIRVDIDFVVSPSLTEEEDAHEYMHWGSILPEAESKIERLIFDNRRMDHESAVRSAIQLPAATLDDFYVELMDKHEGYYADTCSYIHELIEPPLRLINGIALELMVSDLDPDLRFFQNLLPIFREGLWPCGWRGEYPDGKLIVW